MDANRLKRRIRLDNQLKWMQSHNSLAYPKQQQRLEDGQKLKTLLHGLRFASNPRDELATNILFASEQPSDTVRINIYGIHFS